MPDRTVVWGLGVSVLAVWGLGVSEVAMTAAGGGVMIVGSL